VVLSGNAGRLDNARKETITMNKLIAKAILPACAWFALAAVLPAAAQTMKPGLWSLSNKMTSSDPELQQAMSAMQEHMANMPLEQRQQMQKMMQQNGVQLDVGAGGAMQTRMCMTREMAERKEFPVQQGDCKQTYTQQSSTRGRIVFACTKPRMSGEGEVVADNDTSYRAHMKINSEEEGRSRTVDMDVTGKWLSADCGNIRPLAVPRAK
jgi:hypothetical protein